MTRSLALAFFLLTASLTVCAQGLLPSRSSRSSADPRWALVVQGRDSTVVGPWSDFVLFDANYAVANSNIILAGQLLEAEFETNASLTKELKICGDDKQAVTVLLVAEQQARGKVEEDRDHWKQKFDRQKPLATIAKVEIYGLLAFGALYGANKVFHFIPNF